MCTNFSGRRINREGRTNELSLRLDFLARFQEVVSQSVTTRLAEWCVRNNSIAKKRVFAVPGDGILISATDGNACTGGQVLLRFVNELINENEITHANLQDKEDGVESRIRSVLESALRLASFGLTSS